MVSQPSFSQAGLKLRTEHLQVLLPRWKIIQAPMVSFVCWYRKILPISLGRNNYGFGGAASGIALLKDVPVWYELWRNINGFPPDYYQPSKDAAAKNNAAS